MKIVNSLDTAAPPTIHTRDIPMGAVFSGIINEPGIYLNTYWGAVDLDNPRRTWTGATVRNYVELSATLTVGPKGTL